MSEYKGLCIGGPLDGENFTIQSPSFCVPHKTQTLASINDFCETELKSTRYLHNKIQGRNTVFALWVPSDKTIDQALHHLLDFYESKGKAISLIRDNLMNQEGYSPYCAGIGNCSMPRTHFKGDQFHCHECGWVSEFPKDFIQKYKEKWKLNVPRWTQKQIDQINEEADELYKNLPLPDGEKNDS